MAAIPTVGPRDVVFRSRIEAKWAHIFEMLGWDWEYEPIDLNGYIPDFILNGEVPILVEIKGELDIWSTFETHRNKIEASGWTGNYMILGATYEKKFAIVEHDGDIMDDGVNIGICGIIGDDTHWRGWRRNGHSVSVSKALLSRRIYCTGEVEYMISNRGSTHLCRNFNLLRQASVNNLTVAIFDKMWVKAGNLVQWKAPKIGK